MIQLIKNSGDLCELTNSLGSFRGVYRSGLPEKPIYPCAMIYQIGGQSGGQSQGKSYDNILTFSVSVFDRDPAKCDALAEQINIIYTQNDLIKIGQVERWETAMSQDRVYHINLTFRARHTNSDLPIRG